MGRLKAYADHQSWELSVGRADEVSANTHHQNYNSLYQVKNALNLPWPKRDVGCLLFPIRQDLQSNSPDFKAEAMYKRDARRKYEPNGLGFLYHFTFQIYTNLSNPTLPL